MIQAKRDLLVALGEALRSVAPDAAASLTPVFEAPKQAAHGDLAVTAAMQMAKPLKKNPRELATALVAALQAQSAVQQWVEAIEIAGPGFINLRLKPAAKQAIVQEVLGAGAQFGRQSATDRKVLIEFVSANPTGPLHVGHGRQGALGDALCNLFETQGQQVTREFYYNDAGVQIATLASSTQARLKGLKPGDEQWPESAYNGDYIADIARDFLAKATVKADDREFTASGDPDDLDSIRQFAVAYLRHEQDLDLQAFGVRFDNYYLESSLYTSGRVEAAVQKLKDAGKTFEEGGALWLRSTDYGDDKDRVMRKSDGGYTYFVPDVAYHIAKWERGFVQCVNIQGSDHHGTIARVRAGLQAAGVGIPQGWPDYVLHKMVTVMKNGEEVKISKRAGSYVTLRDLIEWTSKDAVRFFLISRKADTEFVFDVDLALKQNDENPVFYVQYAHARIQSVQRQYVDEVLGWPRVKAESFNAFRKELLHWVQLGIASGRFSNADSAVILSRLLANSSSSVHAESSFKVRSRAMLDAVNGQSHLSFARLESIVENLPLDSNHVRKLVHKLARKHPAPQSLLDCLDVMAGVNPAYVRQVFQRFVEPSLLQACIARLTAPTELVLMTKLSEYPDMLTLAAQGLAPHDVAFYLRDLASTFHSYYAAERFLVDDVELTRARVALLSATAQVLRNGLALLGVSAPEKM